MPFWQEKPLQDMTQQEWESLCDGCGRCCLHKLEDAETGQLHYTRVACQLLDIKKCRCSDYTHRFDKVPDCINLKLSLYDSLGWLPRTCAYRLIAEGHDLPDWHPLVSQQHNSVIEAGISVRYLAISESEVDDLEDYVMNDF